ncbi:MSHA biogenesis protein MshP [Vibrio fluminensis]|uniref:MSHA biogenesis protein MshP n=1 Tax=Vibrio fluminensis TaxID=2783614 RepID=UPI001888729E|nr:MSHA biogenesis protein MshP [Vibrio fluminensis]
MSHKQKGGLLVVVVFVLVVMGLLATTLTRIHWSNSDAHTKDVLGTQAWLLAQSVNEEVLTRFYPLNSSSSDVANQCVSSMPWPNFVSVSGRFSHSVMNCQLVGLTCSSVGTLDEMNYYKLFARVRCGSVENVVERTEEIWVRE